MAKKPQKRRRNTRRTRRVLNLDKNISFSYKKSEELKKLINNQGAILSRSITGLPQKKQRRLATAIKRARYLALLPFTQTL